MHGICTVCVCLQILNSFSTFGMDEAMLFKVGKWVDYGKSHTRDKFMLEKGVVWVM